jgi:SAM-dependent methyltransferase
MERRPAIRSRRTGLGPLDDVTPVSNHAGDSSCVDPLIEDVFGAPLRWRAQAALALGLRGDELLGGVSPAAGCPRNLTMVLHHLTRSGAPESIVDIGAGAGGISEWFRRRTGAVVTAIEPLPDARTAAQYLFDSLDVRSGSAEATGLGDDTADAVLMCGVLSLLDDEITALSEACRVARRDSPVAIVDLFSADTETVAVSPNVFRSLGQVSIALEQQGCIIHEIVRNSPVLDPTWASAARRVDGWIDRNCRYHPAYPAWKTDKRHLEDHIASGRVTACCIVARRG